MNLLAMMNNVRVLLGIPEQPRQETRSVLMRGGLLHSALPASSGVLTTKDVREAIACGQRQNSGKGHGPEEMRFPITGSDGVQGFGA